MSVPRRRAAAGVALLLAAWAVAGLGLEAAGFRQRLARPDSGLRLDSPHVQALRQLAAEAAPHLSADALVALAAPGQRSDSEFFLSLWMAYLLPGQRVVPRHRP
ncbi:MAG TPA: hypothetical protein VHQ65_12170, partial [Thermoanaerobaculia bacterium]|nr:hypothetical protein [Thermoanaerobaculia bacterium]